MRFFLDNCVSPRIARALQELNRDQGLTVAHLRELFAPNTPDPEWLNALRVDGDWVIVSGDERISRGREERSAWQEARLTAFFFEDLSRQGFWKQVHEVIRWWPDIQRQAKECTAGSGYVLKFKANAMRQIYTPE